MIVAILTTIACCTTNILGIVFAAMAMGDREPERTEQLARWAWISNIIHIGLLVLAIGGFIVWGITTDS
ncbi:hypothetical protein DEF24_15325 [Marinitenerispora sediminis]|uniref:Uncharacterized protein n=1 Tax=Marinitenerispora sediminis TaxID=1931232 RepID=A0A368T3P3_9ACTN|nr:hypothetical protein DEF24_15325 [Marinitenerispora sediminis]